MSRSLHVTVRNLTVTYREMLVTSTTPFYHRQNGDNAILAAGSLGFRPDDYLSPNMRTGLKMKEKCSTAEGKQAHALRCLGEITV